MKYFTGVSEKTQSNGFTLVLFTERLLAEKEADFIRIAKINEALREVNARLAEENRKLKEG